MRLLKFRRRLKSEIKARNAPFLNTIATLNFTKNGRRFLLSNIVSLSHRKPSFIENCKGNLKLGIFIRVPWQHVKQITHNLIGHFRKLLKFGCTINLRLLPFWDLRQLKRLCNFFDTTLT